MTGTAHCARCGTSMPASAGRAAPRRYCRKAAWHDRHRDDVLKDVAHIVPNVVPGVVVTTASQDDVPTHLVALALTVMAFSSRRLRLAACAAGGTADRQ